MSRFGIRELERILFDLFANLLVEARAKGAKTVAFDVDDLGAIVCKDAAPKPPPAAGQAEPDVSKGP